MNQLSWNNTYWLCRPIDPEDPVNLKAIRLAFVMQLVTDICRETPKIGGLELFIIAQKVTDGRVGKEDVLIKKMGHATMAALQVPLSTLPMRSMVKKEETFTTEPICLLQSNESLEKMNVHAGNR